MSEQNNYLYCFVIDLFPRSRTKIQGTVNVMSLRVTVPCIYEQQVQLTNKARLLPYKMDTMYLLLVVCTVASLSMWWNVSENNIVQFNANAAKPAPIRKLVQFRKQKSICCNDFKNDIMSSNLTNCVITNTDADKLVDIYNEELSLLLDKHAPLLTKTIVLRPSCPWYTDELHNKKTR